MNKKKFSKIAAILIIASMLMQMLPTIALADTAANALAASVVPGTAVSSITISGLGNPAGLKYVYKISNSADAIPAQGAAIPTADYGQYVPGVDIENVSAGKWLNLYDVSYVGEVNGVESYAVIAYYQKQLASEDIKAAASPDTVTDNGNTYTYTVADGKATITAFTSDGSTDITIPSTISGYPVTGIGTEAFKNKSLTSVSIPNSITSIGDGAFSDNRLTNVIIPDGVTRIGDTVFAQNNIASITIPNSVTSIGEGAFVYNELTSIVIPDSVTSIGPTAFSSNQLASVTIPNSVTSIGEGAFFNNQLTSVTIPDSITSIGRKVFCRNQLTSVTIPSSVTSIGEGAFAFNRLTSVTIPNSVRSIEEGAFSYNRLTSIVIPNGIASIGEQAFCCNRLTSVTIPDSVTSIGEEAFANNQLTDATIENSTATIGSNAFSANQSTASNLKIHGYKDSTAETYATANGHTFAALTGGGLSDAQSVAAAKADLDSSDFTFGGTDTASAVTQNFTLPTSGSNGTVITWAEKNDTGGNISISGNSVTVSRPAYGQGDKVVTLTATITKNGAADTKDIAITIKQQPASNSGNSGGGNSTAPVPAPNGSNTAIIVDGKEKRDAATATTEKGKDGHITTTVTINDSRLTEILAGLTGAAAGDEAAPVISIHIEDSSDVVVGELNGRMVKAMEEKETVLEIRTGAATYTLPANEINIDKVSDLLGASVKLSDIKVQIEISKPSEEAAKVINDSNKEGNFILVVPPVEFNIRCTCNGRTIDVSEFNSYVERTIAIPEGVDPQKITTGVIADPDGTVRHVPTKIIVIDGKYYAKINSLTNSIYSVIWHPVEFLDVANHWAKAAVNDMGSRMVINGVGNNMFEPDRDITRAEFAAIIVRALGLRPGTGVNQFADVSGSDWFCDYIKTAAEYRLISGYGDGRFVPNEKITREQAMTMIARAMKITGLKAEFASDDFKNHLVGFQDADKAAGYAKDSIATCIKAGIITGRNGNLIAPKDNITRAEVAVIVRRLLQKSGLI